MSQENVENARRSYATLNEAYRKGDPNLFLPILKESWSPDCVFEPAGVLPDSSPRPHHGWDGVLHFIGNQMEAFSEGWVKADEFIDRGDYLIVPYRFGGTARHTGLPVEFSFVHLVTLRDGKVTRCEVHKTVADAPRSRRALGVGHHSPGAVTAASSILDLVLGTGVAEAVLPTDGRGEAIAASSV